MSEASDSPKKAARKPGTSADAAGKGRKPEWADGLKRLYDSVVEEPLPDAFKDLLSRLDDGKP